MFPVVPLGNFGVSTYFLIISLSCIVSCFWFIRRAGQRGLERLTAIDLLLTLLVTGFLGARLTHVFYEDFAFYRVQPSAILEIWNGGFVYLGGLFAALAGALVFCQIKREPFWFWADTAAPAAALSYALGRLACFANGCCYGRECELPWAVFLHGGHRHPAPLYATTWEFALVGVLLTVEPRLKTSGLLFNIWLAGHALGRLMMEYFRVDPRGEFILGASLGTWMSLTLLSWALFHLGLALGLGTRASDETRRPG